MEFESSTQVRQKIECGEGTMAAEGEGGSKTVQTAQGIKLGTGKRHSK